MVNSRNKGACGERELANILKEYGFASSKRGQQHCGADGSADVIGLHGIHIECKRVQALNIDKAMQQAKDDAMVRGDIPAVFHRKNASKKIGEEEKGKWKVTLSLEDFINMYKSSIK